VPQPSFTERLARWASRRPWLTIGLWLGLLAASIGMIVTLLGSAVVSDRVLSGSDSYEGAQLLETRLAERDESTEQVVVRSETAEANDAEFRAFVSRVQDEIEATGVATGADADVVSPDGHAILIPVNLLAEDESGAEADVEKVIEAVDAADGEAGYSVEIVGKFTGERDLSVLAEKDLQEGEFFFGIPTALVILLLVFGAVVGALLPLMLAGVAIVIALGLTALIGQAVTINLFIINMITGMGLALGIDYALFVLSRYREERAAGRDKVLAIAGAGATSSRAVFFSGLVFVLALLGMLLVPDSILRSLALGAILVGIVAVAAALTLLPAVLGLLGDRVNALRVPFVGRRIIEGGGVEGRFWARTARGVMRRPLLSITVATALLLAATAPVLDLDTGETGIRVYPESTPSRQGYEALVASFPQAGSEPVGVVVDGDVASPPVRQAVERLDARLESDDAFGAVDLETQEATRIALLNVVVLGEALEPPAKDAVKRLRDVYIPEAFAGVPADVLVTGTTAEGIDAGSVASTWLPIVIAFVLALSFVLLTVAFRSIVLPLKAILLNLLSVGAAYGLMTLVFVKGYGADLLGFQQVDEVASWVPLFLFSVLFGLSMDYHVFLLSRIRERFAQTGDNSDAVAYGVASTARLITGAALIMVAVFTGFAIGDLVMFQQMGFGLAVALIIDATIARSVLVPASMQLLGSRNWYLPSWLRWLPDVHMEGHPSAPQEKRPD
jgi:RND superfamily putative drug exporter